MSRCENIAADATNGTADVRVTEAAPRSPMKASHILLGGIPRTHQTRRAAGTNVVVKPPPAPRHRLGRRRGQERKDSVRLPRECHLDPGVACRAVPPGKRPRGSRWPRCVARRRFPTSPPTARTGNASSRPIVRSACSAAGSCRPCARSKNTTASPNAAPFFVPPRLSTSTPARHVRSAGDAPNAATALAKRAPSMWTASFSSRATR